MRQHNQVKKIKIDSEVYISGLNGRLNFILDSSNRTYLYADNIAIEGGQNQPVYFAPNQQFTVEDSLGNRFRKTALSITNKLSTIEYTRLSFPAGGQHSDGNFKVRDQEAKPIKKAQILVIFSDGTFLSGVTDSAGHVRIQKLKNRIVTIFCAHRNYMAFHKEGHDAYSDLVINLKAKPNNGSIIIDRSGYVPGLHGRLNPKADSDNRLYIYADNISIEGQAPACLPWIE
jgi:hypothetical protein